MQEIFLTIWDFKRVSGTPKELVTINLPKFTSHYFKSYSGT